MRFWRRIRKGRGRGLRGLWIGADLGGRDGWTAGVCSLGGLRGPVRCGAWTCYNDRRAAGPQGRRAAGPQGRRAAGPQGRRAAGPQGRRAAGPQGRRQGFVPRASAMSALPSGGPGTRPPRLIPPPAPPPPATSIPHPRGAFLTRPRVRPRRAAPSAAPRRRSRSPFCCRACSRRRPSPRRQPS